APGITGLSPGRPKSAPIIRLYSFLLDKTRVPVTVAVDGQAIAPAHTVTVGATDAPAAPAPTTPTAEISLQSDANTVPLVRLAVARSGDKGDSANIGVIARRPEYLPSIRAALTPAAVGAYFAHVLRGRVERFEVPGIHALNFLLHDALGGGGVASLNLDTQGKTYAQQLLDFPVPVAHTLLRDPA
ncbi:MAG: terpene utilization protein AtuA, partial [Sulfurifustis sp.]